MNVGDSPSLSHTLSLLHGALKGGTELPKLCLVADVILGVSTFGVLGAFSQSCSFASHCGREMYATLVTL